MNTLSDIRDELVEILAYEKALATDEQDQKRIKEIQTAITALDAAIALGDDEVYFCADCGAEMDAETNKAGQGLCPECIMAIQ